MTRYKFGTAIRDITPSEPVMLHGYSARSRVSEGVAEPIRLSSLAIDDGINRMIIIAVDMAGIHTSEIDEICDAIGSETGIGYPNILIAASHTHFAPKISTSFFISSDIGFYVPEEAMKRRVLAAAVGTARESISNMVEGVAERVVVRVPGVAYNRRTVRPDGGVDTNVLYPEQPNSYTISPIDDELTAIRFRSESGTGVVLVNYGCHPVTGGFDTDYYRISSDYVHYLRGTIESSWGMPALFTLGAAGDVVPRNRYGESRKRIGEVLGGTIVLADRMFEPIDGRLEVDSTTVPVETILKFDADSADQLYRSEQEKSLKSESATDGFEDALLGKFRSDLYPDNSFAVPLQFMKIGNVKIAALPFEVLSEFSIRMKGEIADSMLISCAGGYQGYLPFEYEYERGGYEASPRSTHFLPGTADRLYERVIEALGNIGSGD